MICCEGPIDSGEMQLGALPDDRRCQHSSSSPLNKISRKKKKKANLQSASFHAANLICGRWLGYLLSPASDVDRLMVVSQAADWFGSLGLFNRVFLFLSLSKGAFEGKTCGYFRKLQTEDSGTINHVSCTHLFNDLGSMGNDFRPEFQCVLQTEKTAAALKTCLQRIL